MSPVQVPPHIAEWADSSALAVIATTEDGSVIYWNDGAVALYQWSRRQALGRNILKLTPSLQSTEEAGEVMAALREGRSWHGTMILRRRDGSAFAAYVADVPVDRLILGISAPSRQKDAVLREAGRLAGTPTTGL